MQSRIERRWPQPRALPVRRLGDTRPVGRLLGDPRRLRELRLELGSFGVQRASPPLQLEQHGLGGLADEPELAARRVVPEALGRDGRRRDVEQRVERDDRILARRSPAVIDR